MKKVIVSIVIGVAIILVAICALRLALTPTPRVGFIFDDGWESVYTYRSIFTSRGVPIGLAIVTGWLDTSDHLTTNQLLELARQYGWEIANHTHTHTAFDDNNLTLDQIRDEIYTAHNDLLKLGIQPAPYFIQPKAQIGCAGAEAIVSELYPFAFNGMQYQNSFILDSPASELPRFSIDNQVSLVSIEIAIDNAIGNQTGIILRGHQIISGNITNEPPPGSNPPQVSIGKIEDILDYCKANNIPVGLPSKVIRESKYRQQVGTALISAASSFKFVNFKMIHYPARTRY
ncbi:MAG: polysaccharide deacetylase family protein [Dehalococcoidia bacterium]